MVALSSIGNNFEKNRKLHGYKGCFNQSGEGAMRKWGVEIMSLILVQALF